MVVEANYGRQTADTRPKILFVGEGVTLAHIARPLALAESLDASRYNIRFACSENYRHLIVKAGLIWEDLQALDGTEFRARLADARPLYDKELLMDYVCAEREILQRWRPDLIVGDFRISLSISAKAEGIPFVNLCNACWSSFSKLPYAAPDLPITRIMGPKIASWMLNCAGDFIFRRHLKGFNAVRAQFAQSPVKTIREMYSQGDWVLYPDVPCISPTQERPSNHDYLGPLGWSPDCSEPLGWREKAAGWPIIYVTLGSSGDTRVVGRLLAALERLPVFVLIATAGRIKNGRWPSNVKAVDYLPANRILPDASCCIFNGGAETGYQAMRFGVPVLSLPSSIDQFFHANAFSRLGAGLTLRPENVTANLIESTLQRLLDEPTFKASARRIRDEVERYPAIQMFKKFLAARCPEKMWV